MAHPRALRTSVPVEGSTAVSTTSRFEQLRFGREIIQCEAAALSAIADSLGDDFCSAVDQLYACQGNVVVSGMGKAGHVGQKISATLCSTGTPSIFLHPAEAIHGDLGRLHAGDVVLMLSQSGETDEVTRLLPAIALVGAPLVSITGTASSTLGKASSIVLPLGKLEEAGPNALAPSTSTTAMMAMGDALALVVSRLRGFRPEDFARYHPGGSLGLKLSVVDDVMRPLGECRLASQQHPVREVFVEASRPGRRSGAIMLVNEQGKLTGIFTDSDLARLLEHNLDGALDAPIHTVMNASPTSIELGTALPKAVDILATRKFSELPVVDQEGKPAGLLDITDVVALLPHDVPGDESEEDAIETIPFTKKPTSN